MAKKLIIIILSIAVGIGCILLFAFLNQSTYRSNAGYTTPSIKNNYGAELMWNSEVIFKRIKSLRDSGQVQKAFAITDLYWMNRLGHTNYKVLVELESLHQELSESSGHNKKIAEMKLDDEIQRIENKKKEKIQKKLMSIYYDEPTFGFMNSYYKQVETVLLENANNPKSLEIVKCSKAEYSEASEGWLTDCDFRMTNKYGALMKYLGKFKITHDTAKIMWLNEQN